MHNYYIVESERAIMGCGPTGIVTRFSGPFERFDRLTRTLHAANKQTVVLEESAMETSPFLRSRTEQFLRRLSV